MKPEFSLDKISTIFEPSNPKQCNACGLYLNQIPAFDSKKKASIFWVGLSSVLFTEEEIKLPLSPYTRTGALISEIEKLYFNEILFYKTNIVKCLPLKNNKIRYPLKHEMEKCYPNLLLEIKALNPSIIFLLGKQVGSFVFEKLSIKDLSLNEYFNYNSFMIDNIRYVQIHHPSYILVYKRKFINDYIKGVRQFVDTVKIKNSVFENITSSS